MTRQTYAARDYYQGEIAATYTEDRLRSPTESVKWERETTVVRPLRWFRTVASTGRSKLRRSRAVVERGTIERGGVAREPLRIPSSRELGRLLQRVGWLEERRIPVVPARVTPQTDPLVFVILVPGR